MQKSRKTILGNYHKSFCRLYFSIIKEIIESGQTTTIINRSFPADQMTNPANFKSLLYYFGLLTISDIEEGRPLLAIPNQTVREQMYTYLIECYQQAEVFTLSLDLLPDLTHSMIYRGEWKPVFTYIASELEQQSRIREFIDGEAHIKGFLLAYLGLTENYLLLPEYEANKGYADFYFQPVKAGIKYAYLLEVKYAKHNASSAKIETLVQEAREQLLKYATDPMVEQRRCKIKAHHSSVQGLGVRGNGRGVLPSPNSLVDFAFFSGLSTSNM